MSIMILRKSLAIGVIALFIGLVYIPMSDANVNEKELMVPIELSVMNADGTIGTKILELSEDVIYELTDLLDELNHAQNKHGIIERLSRFFNDHPSCSGLKGLISADLLEKLPGNPIVSIGKGRSLAARYHGRVMAKKIITAWNYPDGLGATVIWGDGVTAQPTQILLKRQVGFMIGFVGLYVYIPPILEGMKSTTFFMGSSLFAYGISV